MSESSTARAPTATAPATAPAIATAIAPVIAIAPADRLAVLLQQLENALANSDLGQLNRVSDLLRRELAATPPTSVRQIARCAPILASCAELLGRSASTNHRALMALFGPTTAVGYSANGATGIVAPASVNIQT